MERMKDKGTDKGPGYLENSNREHIKQTAYYRNLMKKSPGEKYQ